MERIPATPPHIAPLPPGGNRPLWSVMIPVYNCSRYLEHTIESVLKQDPGPDNMQIEVIDDCSTDADIAALVARAGKGRVAYYRKEQNMGSIRNFETCINRAQGKLVHILHGDDFVLDGFYKEVGSLFDMYPAIGAAFSDFDYVDEQDKRMYDEGKLLDKPGVLKDWLFTIAVKQRIQPPSMVVKRSVYEQLGSYNAVKYGEDWEMWVRIAAHFPVAHTPVHLACYRVHSNNVTGQSLATGQNIEDIKKVIGIIQNYLPDDKKAVLKKTAQKHFSIYFAWQAHKLYHDSNNKEAAMKQINGALSLSANAKTLLLALKLYAKLLVNY